MQLSDKANKAEVDVRHKKSLVKKMANQQELISKKLLAANEGVQQIESSQNLILEKLGHLERSLDIEDGIDPDSKLHNGISGQYY